jgi:hypothetical protein
MFPKHKIKMKNPIRFIATALALCLLFTGCSKITKENYDQIKTGMTPGQVSEILGKPMDKTETDLSGAGLGKSEMWVYSSAGYGGKGIMITFQNGKVFDKSWSE